MRFNKSLISLVLVMALVMTSLPAMAGQDFAVGATDTDKDNKTLKTVIGVTVTAVAVFFVGRIMKNRKNKRQAATFYEKGNIYAEQGQWDKAVEAYQKAIDYYPDYKDLKTRLTAAKVEAEAMFIKKGDNAKDQEKYEEAIAYYQKALDYNPASLDAKNRIDNLATEMVEVHYRRGYSYEVQGQWQEAYNEYKKAYYYKPQYKDLADRYNRTKAKIDGDLPLRAILFFVNHTEQRGLEKPLIHELQTQIEAEVSSNFYLLDQNKVQTVMNEQAAAMGDELNSGLAIDLGNIMGVDEVLIGNIKSIYTKRKRVRMELDIEIINIKKEKTIKIIEYTHKFSKGVTENNIEKALPEIVEELVERLVD